MELTIEFIKENFHKYNKEYFDGVLKEPKFEISKTKRQLGCMQRKCGSYLIRVSNYYDRSEHDYLNTLIHEMIHLYIRQQGIKDTNTHHGRVFYAWADKINKHGWEIARCNSVGDAPLTNGGNTTYYIGAFLTDNCNYFYFRFTPTNLREYKDFLCEKKRYMIFTSHNDNKFNKLTTCRSRLRGYYLTKEEYDTFFNDYGEKMLYSSDC